MTFAEITADADEDLSASTLFVLYVLVDDGGSMTSDELASQTQLDERTVRYAVENLREASIVESKPSPHDPRCMIHVVDDR